MYRQIDLGKIYLSADYVILQGGHRMTNLVSNLEFVWIPMHSHTGVLRQSADAQNSPPLHYGTVNPFIFAFTRFICTVLLQRTVNQTKYLDPRQ